MDMFLECREHKHPIVNLIPASAGPFIAVAGYMAARHPKKLPGWPSLFNQNPHHDDAGFDFFGGVQFYHDAVVSWPAHVSVIGDPATLVVCFKCLFVASAAFQEEFEEGKSG